jgi:hypothetical protein
MRREVYGGATPPRLISRSTENASLCHVQEICFLHYCQLMTMNARRLFVLVESRTCFTQPLGKPEGTFNKGKIKKGLIIIFKVTFGMSL